MAYYDIRLVIESKEDYTPEVLANARELMKLTGLLAPQYQFELGDFSVLGPLKKAELDTNQCLYCDGSGKRVIDPKPESAKESDDAKRS
jgi:hypothetical protein